MIIRDFFVNYPRNFQNRDRRHFPIWPLPSIQHKMVSSSIGDTTSPSHSWSISSTAGISHVFPPNWFLFWPNSMAPHKLLGDALFEVTNSRWDIETSHSVAKRSKIIPLHLRARAGHKRYNRPAAGASNSEALLPQDHPTRHTSTHCAEKCDTEEIHPVSRISHFCVVAPK